MSTIDDHEASAATASVVKQWDEMDGIAKMSKHDENELAAKIEALDDDTHICTDDTDDPAFVFLCPAADLKQIIARGEQWVESEDLLITDVRVRRGMLKYIVMFEGGKYRVFNAGYFRLTETEFDNLADAMRFISNGGSVKPRPLTQHAAPPATEEV